MFIHNHKTINNLLAGFGFIFQGLGRGRRKNKDDLKVFIILF